VAEKPGKIRSTILILFLNATASPTLQRHLPYHESDHVLNHNALRRNDEAFLDGLGYNVLLIRQPVEILLDGLVKTLFWGSWKAINAAPTEV
jgi:hypothetical protein